MVKALSGELPFMGQIVFSHISVRGKKKPCLEISVKDKENSLKLKEKQSFVITPWVCCYVFQPQNWIIMTLCFRGFQTMGQC